MATNLSQPQFDSSIGVAICTFGDVEWRRKAYDALLSVENQTIQPKNVVINHAETLAEARNEAAKALDTEWVIFLDADDTLAHNYIQLMQAKEFDILAPLVKYSNQDTPRRLNGDCILYTNWIVIGAPFRYTFFERIGGFREMPGLEDWDLWIRMWLEGATIGAFDGCYFVEERAESRNKSFDPEPIYKYVHEVYHPLAKERNLI